MKALLIKPVNENEINDIEFTFNDKENNIKIKKQFENNIKEIDYIDAFFKGNDIINCSMMEYSKEFEHTYKTSTLWEEFSIEGNMYQVMIDNIIKYYDKELLKHDKFKPTFDNVTVKIDGIYKLLLFHNITDNFYEHNGSILNVNRIGFMIGPSKQSNFFGHTILYKYDCESKKLANINYVDVYKLLYEYYIINIIKFNNGQLTLIKCQNSSDAKYLLNPVRLIDKRYIVSEINNEKYYAKIDPKHTPESYNDYMETYKKNIKDVQVGYFENCTDDDVNYLVSSPDV